MYPEECTMSNVQLKTIFYFSRFFKRKPASQNMEFWLRPQFYATYSYFRYELNLIFVCTDCMNTNKVVFRNSYSNFVDQPIEKSKFETKFEMKSIHRGRNLIEWKKNSRSIKGEVSILNTFDGLSFYYGQNLNSKWLYHHSHREFKRTTQFHWTIQ